MVHYFLHLLKELTQPIILIFYKLKRIGGREMGLAFENPSFQNKLDLVGAK
jgi:hypothetical protein